MSKRLKGFKKELAEEMMAFFALPSEGGWDTIRERGLPSFVKFAYQKGLTLEELRSFREKHPDFHLAYQECEARIQDLLIDGVLMKRFDATFAKLLLQTQADGERAEGGSPFDLVLTVLHE